MYSTGDKVLSSQLIFNVRRGSAKSFQVLSSQNIQVSRAQT